MAKPFHFYVIIDKLGKQGIQELTVMTFRIKIATVKSNLLD